MGVGDYKYIVAIEIDERVIGIIEICREPEVCGEKDGIRTYKPGNIFDLSGIYLDDGSFFYCSYSKEEFNILCNIVGKKEHAKSNKYKSGS